MLNDTLLYHLLHVVIIDGPDSLDGTTVQFSCVVGFSFVAGAMEVDFFVNNTATNQPNIAEDFTIILNTTTLTLTLNLTTTDNIIMTLRYNVEV